MSNQETRKRLEEIEASLIKFNSYSKSTLASVNGKAPDLPYRRTITASLMQPSVNKKEMELCAQSDSLTTIDKYYDTFGAGMPFVLGSFYFPFFEKL